MTALDYYIGFSLDSTSTIADSSASLTAGPGTLCHVSLASSSDPWAATFVDLATTLQTAMVALGSAGFTCVFNAAAGTYTITFNTSLTATGPIAGALGLVSGHAYTGGTVTSVVRPTYLIRAAEPGRSAVLPWYQEPDGITVEAVADDGKAYGVSRDTSELLVQWSQDMEPSAAVYKEHALTAVPYTWSSFFSDARMEFPIALSSDGISAAVGIYQLRADAKFAPVPVVSDWDGLYRVPIKARYLGSTAAFAPPGAPTISGTPSVGGTMTIASGGGGPHTSYSLYRGGVLVGTITTPYTYVVADVGPALTVKDVGPGGTSAASNTLQFSLPTANIAGDWDSYTAGHYHLTSGLVDTAYDQSGAGNDLTQSNAAHRPAIASAGGPDAVHDAFNFALLAGASVSLRKNAMGLGSAITVYSVTQVPPNLGYISGGANADTRDTFVTGGNIDLYAGSNACAVAATTGTWIVDAAVYNGASSAHSINGGTQATGNPGSGTDAGHVWGGQFADVSSNCLQEKAVRQIVYNAAHSAGTVADISAYLKWWSGL